MAVWLRSGLAVAATCVLTSCTGWQSSFNAQAAQSEEIKRILLIFVAVSTVVWVAVMLVLLFGLIRRRPLRERPLDLPEAYEHRGVSVVLVAGITTTITLLALSF